MPIGHQFIVILYQEINTVFTWQLIFYICCSDDPMVSLPAQAPTQFSLPGFVHSMLELQQCVACANTEGLFPCFYWSLAL
jgi:hypothetical protein